MIRLVVVGPATADDGPEPDTVADLIAGRARGVRVPVGTVGTAADADALRAELAAAAAAGHGVGVVPCDLVAHPSVLGDVLDDPRRPVAALVLDDGRPGALRLDAAAAAAAAGRLDPAGPPAAGADLLAVALAAVTAAGRPVARVRPGRLVALRPGGNADARNAAFDALSARSEHRTRLAGAARAGDGFYSTFVVRRLSRPLTGVAVRLGLAPNTVTLVSLAIGLAAAWLLTGDGVAVRVLGAVLLQLSLVVDCVDGEVARYTRRFTPLGAWLDGVGDRVKEYAVLAALAVAATRAAAEGAGGDAGAGGPWLLAVTAMALMTYRHVADHHFTERVRAGTPPPAAGLAAEPESVRETPVVWLRRVLQLPVGERWLLLSVAVVVAGPRAALVLFAAAAAASLVWTTGGRVLRSRRFRGLPAEQLGWLAPALRWLAEATVVALAVHQVAPAATWTAYVLLAVVAYHLYDTVYRARYRVPHAAPNVERAGLGHARRAFVVLALAVVVALPGPLPDAVLPVGTLLLAGWLALVFGLDSVRAWRRWLRSRPPMEEDTP